MVHNGLIKNYCHETKIKCNFASPSLGPKNIPKKLWNATVFGVKKFLSCGRNEKNTCCLGDKRDDTTQVNGDYNQPFLGSLLNNQDSLVFVAQMWCDSISAKEMVAVCGSGDALGQWTVAKALPLDAGESSQWLPRGNVRLFGVKNFRFKNMKGVCTCIAGVFWTSN